MNPMKISCPLLLEFDPDDRAAVRSAFAEAPLMTMGQAWREEVEPGFHPAEVRVGWRDQSLMVFAELIDRELVTKATEDNQPLWMLGDVFEIFLRDIEGERYVEFHIAPNGKRLQLVFPDASTIQRVGEREIRIEELMVGPEMFEFVQWVEGEKWCLCAKVPGSAFLPPGTDLSRRTWLASFSRYDYGSDLGEPVISSTSEHALASFHRQQEWAEIVFARATE